MNDIQPYRQRLEARMLEIAERVVASDGLAAVQARRIAQEADCSVGTLYNIFNDLDGLIIGANTRTLRALGEILETAARSAGSAPLQDQLMALALAYCDFAYRQTRRWRALFEHQMQTGRPVPETYRDEQIALLRLVEQCLSGHIPTAPDRSTAARALFSAVHGIAWLALDNKLGPQTRQETEQQVRFIVNAAAAGVAAGER